MSEKRPILTLKRKTCNNVVVAKPLPEPKKPEKKEAKKEQEPAPAKEKPKQKEPKVTMPLSEAIEQLQKFWPALFDNGVPRLMKIGIFAELCTDSQKNDYGMSNKKIKRCLASITRSENYLAAQMTGAILYDLNGQPSGEVNENGEQYAIKRLLRVKTQMSKKV